MVKRPGATTDEQVPPQLKTDGGKIAGRATHGTMTIESTEGKFENGTLTLNFGKDASFVGKVDGDKIVGNMMHGADEKVPVELKKVVPAAVAPTVGPINV